jgi:hypothetical protein
VLAKVPRQWFQIREGRIGKLGGGVPRTGLESRWNFLPKFIQKTRFFGLGTLEPACVRSGSRRVCEAIFDAGGVAV